MGSRTYWRQIRKWLLVFALMAFVAGAIVTWLVGGALVAPVNRVVGPPPNDFPASSVEIPSDSGTTLAAWHLRVPNSNTTAILLHGIRADRRSMISRARLLHKHGYSTLLVDLQAHGESKGKHITVGYLEKHDVLAAVEYVRGTDPNQRIAIIGCSLGGAATLLAQPDVDAIVLEAVYPTISEAVHNRVQVRLGFLHHIAAPLLLVQLNLRLGISPDQLRPIDHINKIKCPVLIASGGRDQHTTIQETRRMFDAANEPKKLVVFDTAAHVDLLAHDPVKYEKEIIAYLNQIIGPRVQNDE